MREYEIGNYLRGYYEVNADTDKAAWESGRAMFAHLYPSEMWDEETQKFYTLPLEGTARFVYLAEVVRRPIWLTPGVSDRYRACPFTRVVMAGMTNEPFPEEWPENLIGDYDG